jgi:hypothetical protein
MAVIAGPGDLDKFRGELRGKTVLSAAPHASTPSKVPLSHLLTDAELETAATAPDPTSGNPAMLPLGFTRPGVGGRSAAGAAGGRAGAAGRAGAGLGFRAQLNKFLKDEGVLVALSAGNGPDGGTIMGPAAGSTATKDAELPPPSVVITNKHYNRIARLLDKYIPVTLEFDLGARFSESGDSFNITGEIPGTDPNAGLVMLGGISTRGRAAPAPPTTAQARPRQWRRCAF